MLQLPKKILFLFLFLIVSCTSVEKNIDETKEVKKVSVEQVAHEKFGKNYSLDYNTSKEFVICRNGNRQRVASNPPIKYFIYDINNNQIIEENVIPLGNITWVSKFEARVEIHPGMIQKNVEPNNGYILNVKTNLKTKINKGVN